MAAIRWGKTMDPSTRREIYVTIRANGVWSARYVALLGLSTVIASFGLLANSPAVVIGAMIIAPLMGPILGLSMGIVVGSPLLERRALMAEILGALMCLLIAFGIGSLPYLPEISHEILARTSPNAFDIAVALASGVAGAYASVSPKVGSALAGVAIAVALVPPLASSGILFAYGEVRLGFGALVLWVTNFLSIELAAVVVFLLYGFGGYRGTDSSRPRRLFLHLAPSVVALVLVAWYLTHTLVRLVMEENGNRLVRSVLAGQIAKRSGGMLDEARVERRGSTWQIVATALTPQPFEPAQVASMQKALHDAGVDSPDLIVRSIVSEDMGPTGRAFVSELEKPKMALAAQEAQALEKVRGTLESQFRNLDAIELVEVKRDQTNGEPTFTAIVRAPEPVGPRDVEAAERALVDAIGYRARLIVRTTIARDADREGFLHQPAAEPESPEITRLSDRLRVIVARRIASAMGASVTSVSIQRDGKTLLANLSLESAQPIDPRAFEELQADLARHVDARLRLRVRTSLVYRSEPPQTDGSGELSAQGER